MTLDPAESGITKAHAEAIAAKCVELDIFLFVRPSEAETMHLIDAGFATKSMDIHDKSSNWGPMAGTVPLDPAFSKKYDAYDAPVASANPEAYSRKVLQRCGDACVPHHKKCSVAAHGVERPTQLILSDKVLKLWTHLGKIGTDPPGETGDVRTYVATVPDARRLARSIPGSTKFVLERFPMPDEVLTKWGLPKDAEHRTFWRVSYQYGTAALAPLFVWAYPVDDCPPAWDSVAERWSTVLPSGATYSWPWKTLRPVTGDYDLWMVAPHLCWWKLHTHVVKFTDHHGVPSAATFFNNWLLHQLNVECDRASNPVFNHGAEEQNYGFTQALDKRLVMFTSGGNARMVMMEDMPRVTAELVHAGYLCLWNKRYDEVKPALCGVEFATLATAYQRARTELGAVVEAGPPVMAGRTVVDWVRYHRDHSAWNEEVLSKKAALDTAAKALHARRVEYARMSTFAADVVVQHQALNAARPGTTSHPGLVKLTSGDFSSRRAKVLGETNPMRVPDALLPVQWDLQRLLMNLTAAGGGGESDVDTLERWWDSEEGTQIAFKLSEQVQAAPVKSASIDFIPVKVASAQDTFEIRLRPPKDPGR